MTHDAATNARLDRARALLARKATANEGVQEVLKQIRATTSGNERLALLRAYRNMKSRWAFPWYHEPVFGAQATHFWKGLSFREAEPIIRQLLTERRIEEVFLGRVGLEYFLTPENAERLLPLLMGLVKHPSPDLAGTSTVSLRKVTRSLSQPSRQVVIPLAQGGLREKTAAARLLAARESRGELARCLELLRDAAGESREVLQALAMAPRWEDLTVREAKLVCELLRDMERSDGTKHKVRESVAPNVRSALGAAKDLPREVAAVFENAIHQAEKDRRRPPWEHLGRAERVLATGRVQAAATILREADETLARLLADKPSWWEYLNAASQTKCQLAKTSVLLGDWPAGLDYMRQAEELALRGTQDYDALALDVGPTGWHDLGTVSLGIDQFEWALHAFEQESAGLERALGRWPHSGHYQTKRLANLYCFGLVLGALGRHPKAEKALLDAEGLGERLLSEFDQDGRVRIARQLFGVRLELAATYRGLDRPAEALSFLQKAGRNAPDLPADCTENLLDAFADAASHLDAKGRKNEAEVFRSAAKTLTQTLPAPARTDRVRQAMKRLRIGTA